MVIRDLDVQDAKATSFKTIATGTVFKCNPNENGVQGRVFLKVNRDYMYDIEYCKLWEMHELHIITNYEEMEAKLDIKRKVV